MRAAMIRKIQPKQTTARRATARPCLGIQVANARPKLVMAVPWTSTVAMIKAVLNSFAATPGVW